MRTIAVTNQKGGTGKTTTVTNLGACLAKAGKKILVVDLDSQANLTSHLGVNPADLKTTILDILSRDSRVKAKDVIIPTRVKNLSIIPSNMNLTGIEIELAGEIGRETVLKNALKDIHNFDYIFIDCPPSLGLLTLNALTTAKEIFIALQTEYFALEGLAKLMNTIALVKKRLNPIIKITGIIPTMCDMRTNLTNDVLNKIKNHFKKEVFNTIIRNNVRLAEAPSFGESILQYSPSSNGAKDYIKLAQEVIRQG